MEAGPLGRLDRWRSDQAMDEERGRELAEFVELRARSGDEVATRAAYLSTLSIRPGERVLDVGCGTGVVTRDIAHLLSNDGYVLGLEPNPYLVAEGRRIAADEGVDGAVEWAFADARRLPIADAAFDVVICATVLAHIPDGAAAVPELVRVLRPGGRLAVFEIDPESFLLAHPDRPMTRRILAAATDQGFANAEVARRLPSLLRAAGVEDVHLRAFTSLETDRQGFLARAAELRPVVAAQAGAITQVEGDRWLAQLHAEMAAGRFLAGTTYVYAWGTKPA
jgi:ubiquinone/menaquinone biosynthesis C-methylase UbiE